MIVLPPLTSPDSAIAAWVEQTLKNATSAPYSRTISPKPGIVPNVGNDTRINLGVGKYILPDLSGLKHIGIYGQGSQSIVFAPSPIRQWPI